MPSTPAPSSSPITALVFGASRASVSKTYTRPSPARAFSAERRANARTLRGSSCRWLRSDVGPKTTPPPFHCGARIVPCRARPVPFWRHGLRLPPRTAERLRVWALPLRWFARYAFAACHITAS